MDYFDFLKELLSTYLSFYFNQFSKMAFSSSGFPIIKIFFGVVIFISFINFTINHFTIYHPVMKEGYEELKEKREGD